MKTYLIQITSGRGPEECARVVAKVLEKMLKEARTQSLETETGHLNGTLLSALVQVKGKDPAPFIGQ